MGLRRYPTNFPLESTTFGGVDVVDAAGAAADGAAAFSAKSGVAKSRPRHTTP
jgi:hypothetical protein